MGRARCHRGLARPLQLASPSSSPATALWVMQTAVMLLGATPGPQAPGSQHPRELSAPSPLASVLDYGLKEANDPAGRPSWGWRQWPMEGG